MQRSSTVSTKQLPRKKIYVAAIAVLVVGITAIAMSTQIGPRQMSVDGLLDNWGPQDMAKRAQYVLIGTVNDKTVSSVDHDPARWEKPMVYTDVTIDVDQDVAEKYKDQQITVRTLGGKTDKYWINVSYSPTFEIGDKVLIFVSREPGSEMGDNYFVLAQEFGKYKIVDGKAYGKDRENGTDLDQFTQEIRSALSKDAQSSNPN